MHTHSNLRFNDQVKRVVQSLSFSFIIPCWPQESYPCFYLFLSRLLEFPLLCSQPEFTPPSAISTTCNHCTSNHPRESSSNHAHVSLIALVFRLFHKLHFRPFNSLLARVQHQIYWDPRVLHNLVLSFSSLPGLRFKVPLINSNFIVLSCILCQLFFVCLWSFLITNRWFTGQ